MRKVPVLTERFFAFSSKFYLQIKISGWDVNTYQTFTSPSERPPNTYHGAELSCCPATQSGSGATHACTGARPSQRRGIGIYTVLYRRIDVLGSLFAGAVARSHHNRARRWRGMVPGALRLRGIMMSHSSFYNVRRDMGSAFRKRDGGAAIEGLRMVGGSERATPAGVYSILPAATFEAYAMTLAKAGKSSSSKYGGILRS